ncbi:MAG: serine/threonine-protein kinase, partial [Pseudomonadales bacterium]
MPADVDDGADERKRRANEVIASYLEAVDAGEQPDPSEMLAEYRDLRDELAPFFTDLDQFEQLAKSLQAVVAGRVEHPSEVTQSLSDATAGTTAADDSSNSLDQQHFGDYELLEEIARGGMGVVYKARQISLNRIVALKMILAGQLASPAELRRFHAEAEAAAKFDHPGIVPIFEVGEYDGQHFFSMGYVDGDSLAARLREGPLASRASAILLKKICQAVQYAHEHDVIHRDLKPANILLSVTDQQTLAENELGVETGDLNVTPRITDFGLAKRLQGESELTGTGQILGTPSYMSPEQAVGSSQQIGPASDLYSLGAILYQMLTGRPPFQAETPLATLSQLLESEPVPPRLLNSDVPRDLEAICMKCLEKQPASRYRSASDLSDDLQRYLEGEEIHASSINLLDRVARALRPSRHEQHFRGWGLGLMAFGLVIFLSHIAIFVLERTWYDSRATYFLPRTVMFGGLLVILWKFRRHSVLPTHAAERLVWVVWVGYLLSLGAVNAARSVFGHDQRESYASFAILTGFGFLIMGAHIWGGGYVVGLVFMIAAPLLAMYTEVAPLVFGVLWAAALFCFGLQ